MAGPGHLRSVRTLSAESQLYGPASREWVLLDCVSPIQGEEIVEWLSQSKGMMLRFYSFKTQIHRRIKSSATPFHCPWPLTTLTINRPRAVCGDALFPTAAFSVAIGVFWLRPAVGSGAVDAVCGPPGGSTRPIDPGHPGDFVPGCETAGRR